MFSPKNCCIASLIFLIVVIICTTIITAPGIKVSLGDTEVKSVLLQDASLAPMRASIAGIFDLKTRIQNEVSGFDYFLVWLLESAFLLTVLISVLVYVLRRPRSVTPAPVFNVTNHYHYFF